MLFSSLEFIFGFLPIALLAFHVTQLFFSRKATLSVVIVSSFIFYGWWNPPYLALLLGSITANYLIAKRLTSYPNNRLLLTGLALNLGVLGYFKYRNFFFENLSHITGTSWNLEPVFVPLAISFFTFQQIAFLIDVKDGRSAAHDAITYTAFIALFPQLIAGPIILFREVEQQFQKIGVNKNHLITAFGTGLIVFSIGMFKKIALADSIAPYADTAFIMADKLTFLEAWAGAIAYSLQLYFDFSGYSDMAVGLGLMLGIQLPFNFDVPFRSTSMVEFWKRWHITMTRFFMMYVYSPIALSLMRWTASRQLPVPSKFFLTILIPVTITFLLSGLWHGAAWTFVAFGAVNAVGLAINHAWKEFKLPTLPSLVGWLLTMITVVVSFVYFRAASLEDAHSIILAMFNPIEIILPNWINQTAEILGIPWQTLSFLATGSYSIRLFAWTILLISLSMIRTNPAANLHRISPSWRYAFVVAAGFLIALGLLDRPQTFIYFQF